VQQTVVCEPPSRWLRKARCITIDARSRNCRLPWPMLVACMTEGIAWAVLHGYGPLYLRQALGETRLSMVALCTGLMSLTTCVMANVWGRWADRGISTFGLIRGGLTGATAIALLFPWVKHSLLYVMLCMSICACLAGVAPLTLAWATAQNPEQPGRQVSRFYRTRAIGSTLGSFGGSLLVRLTGIEGFVLALRTTAAFFLMAVLALRLTGPGYTDPRTTRSLGRPVPPHAVGAASLWRDPLVTAMAVAVFFSFGSNETFFSLVGPYYTEYLAGSAADLGLALGVAGIVGLLASGPVGRLVDWRGPRNAFIFGTISYIGVYGLLCLFHSPLAVLILFAVPVYPLIAIGATGLLNQHVAPGQRAEAMATFEGSAALALAGGSLFAGLGTDRLGLAALPFISLILAIVGAAITLLRVRELTRLAGKAVERYSATHRSESWFPRDQES
jgi:predicted MFS family arabinose efflux permease